MAYPKAVADLAGSIRSLMWSIIKEKCSPFIGTNPPLFSAPPSTLSPPGSKPKSATGPRAVVLPLCVRIKYVKSPVPSCSWKLVVSMTKIHKCMPLMINLPLSRYIYGIAGSDRGGEEEVDRCSRQGQGQRLLSLQ